MPTTRNPHVPTRLNHHASKRLARFRPWHLAMAIALCTAACQPVDQPVPEEGAQDALPDQEAWNTTIYLSRDGRQEATIRAGHRLYFSETNVTVIDEGIHVEFFEDDGSLASTLEAEWGEIDGLTHNLRVRGGVTVHSTERGTLETDSLTWLNAANLIVTDAAVRLTGDTDVIAGDGFEADPGMRRYIIRRNVKGRFLPDAQPQ
ncbi:MAG: LPS export ABC transporter periplasmic protein LptC [Gemmatimonadetes bacterium]|nr:LPS export ABC transporter periplasmic protein LptC [Gemmatimonadota bacterium]MYG16443.1 LPS export ABC transporter periplasmic protein LptC [Gemmatimonadota bacterium]